MSEFFKSKNLINFIGNSKCYKDIECLVRSDRCKNGASIMVHGPNGIGKSTLCYQMARIILSNFSDTLLPRHKILNLTHSDFFVLDSDAQDNGKITVDNMREMLSFCRYMPAESQFKVVIIDKIDGATSSSANALLKVLEEPPKNTFIFLVADQIGSALPTLRSRCLKFQMNALNVTEFIQILDSKAQFDSFQSEFSGAPDNNLLFNDIDSQAGDVISNAPGSENLPESTGAKCNNKEYNKLYRSSFGSVTLACTLQDDGIADVFDIVEDIILNRNKTLENIEYLIEASQSISGWRIVQRSIFNVLACKMRDEPGSENLNKRVNYLSKLSLKFRDSDIFNLDRKSLIYSILC